MVSPQGHHIYLGDWFHTKPKFRFSFWYLQASSYLYKDTSSEKAHVDVVAFDQSIHCKMPENPAFIGDLNSNHATGQDSSAIDSDSASAQTYIREKDDMGHSLDVQGQQNRRRSDTTSLMIILSQTSSRLTKSISSVTKFPASANGKAKEWPKLPESKSVTRYLGLFLAFISGVMMTTYSSMIKMLDTMDSMQVVVIRGSLQFFIMGSIAIYKNVPFKGNLFIQFLI